MEVVCLAEAYKTLPRAEFAVWLMFLSSEPEELLRGRRYNASRLGYSERRYNEILVCLKRNGFIESKTGKIKILKHPAGRAWSNLASGNLATRSAR